MTHPLAAPHHRSEAMFEPAVDPRVSVGDAVTEDLLQTLSLLEADLERETLLREAAQRKIERARQDHEGAYERLLIRCRQLEEEKRRWADIGASNLADRDAQAAAQRVLEARIVDMDRDHREAMERQARELTEGAADRLRDIEDRHRAAMAARGEAEEAGMRAHRVALDALTRSSGEALDALTRSSEDALDAAARSSEDALAALTRSQEAERDRMTGAHALALAEAEDNAEALRLGLARAEKDFRLEAYRLSTLVAFQIKEAETARAEAATLRDELGLVLSSRSWQLARPLRVVTRIMRRAGRAPRRIVRAIRPGR